MIILISRPKLLQNPAAWGRFAYVDEKELVFRVDFSLLLTFNFLFLVATLFFEIIALLDFLSYEALMSFG